VGAEYKNRYEQTQQALTSANARTTFYRFRYERALGEIAEMEAGRRFHGYDWGFLRERRNRVLDDLLGRPELAGWEGRHGRIYWHGEYLMDSNSGVNGFVFVASDDGYIGKSHVFYYEILQDDGTFVFTGDTENDVEIMWTHIATLFDRLEIDS